MNTLSHRATAALALLVASVTLGCAGLMPGSSGGGAAEERIVRPDAPSEYDVLVAQQLEYQGRLGDALAAWERAVAKDGDSAYLHKQLAESLARQSRLEEALHHASRAYALDPEDVPTRIFLGQLYRLNRDSAAAEELLLDDAGEPIDETAALLLYQLYLETSQEESALEVAQWMLVREPDSLRSRVALANAYRRMGRTDEAEEELRKALAQDPRNLRLYMELARAAQQRGDRATEITIYREALAHHPHNHATLVALGEAQMVVDDLDGAIESFEEVESRYPSDLRSAVRLGFLYYEARRYPEAGARFERAIAANPEEHQLAFFLGVVRRRSGDPDGAIAAFERLSPEHSQYADARTQIAGILERRGDFETALEEVNRAVLVDPSRERELYAAILRSKTGDLNGAVIQLEELLAESPEDDELLYNLGVVYGEAKHNEEAVRYMQAALDHNPENASALNYIGYTWAEEGRNLDEAESMIERAIELRPEDGYIVDSLGWVYYMRARQLVESGKRGAARPYLERALEELGRADQLTGGDSVVSEHIGDTYLLLDQKREALDHFEEAVRLEPRESEQPDLWDKLEALRRELE